MTPYTRRPNPYPRHIVERFWSKVAVGSDDECWPFLGGVRHEYGCFWDGNQNRQAHAFSLELATGILPGRLHALHSCDNPPCVNPGHLRWGHPQDNARDRAERNRGCRLKGEQNPSAKLTAADVIDIRHAALTGRSNSSQASQYGVTAAAIRLIVTRQNWRHIPETVVSA